MILPSLLAPLSLPAALLLLGLQDDQDRVLVSPGASGSARVAVERPENELSEDRTLVLYDVGDLTGGSKADAGMPEIADTTSAEDALRVLAQLDEHKARMERARAASEALGEVLELYMEPGFDQDTNNLRQLDMGSFVFFGTPEQHEWVRAFLAVQRAFDGFVSLETKVLDVPARALADLGVEGTARVFEQAAEAEALLAQLGAREGVETITSPRIVTYPRQRGTVSVLNQVAYIKDYKLEIVEPGAVEIADPEIAVLQEGVVLDVRAVPLASGVFGVEIDLQHSELERPIKTKKMVIGAARGEVTVSMPELTQVGVTSNMKLADGAWVFFVTPDGSSGRDLIVSFRLRHVSESEIAAKGERGSK